MSEEQKPGTPAAPGGKPAAAAPAAADGNILNQIIARGKMARDEVQGARAKDLISEFVDQIVDRSTVISHDMQAMISARIAQIDELLSKQVNAILHNEEFQRLEGTWRGMWYLIYNTETSPDLQLRVLNVTKKELLTDLERAPEFDQSAMFKKVYEEEFGTFGGHPYSFLVGDYEFSRHPQDMILLEKIAQVAAAAHAPFVSAASPNLFDMDSFTELSGPRDLAKIFESSELITWRAFRDSEDSRYVTLTMPHVLGRLPYGPKTRPVEEFNYVEDTDGRDHRKYLWMNAAYALAARITDAFAKYRWTAAIRGVEGGGLVEGLPVHTFTSDDGDIAVKCPTEIAITDRREKELSDLGFLPLCYEKKSNRACFFGSSTANKPKLWDTPQANANASLSSQLPYVLVASRFGHYIKAIMRDKIGSFATKDNVAYFLNRWITNYTIDMDEASQAVKATNPLREARVDVFDIPGKPGCYRATVFLRPHFQLNQLSASIRLVAELPPPAQI